MDMRLVWRLATPILEDREAKYDRPFSIKDDEHDRRAARHSHIPNVFPKPEFPVANSGNKVRLQKLVKDHMKTLISWFRGSIIYSVGETSTNLSTHVASRL